MTDLVERLHGPVQWGYMCLADGGFICDDAPVEAASALAVVDAERETGQQQINELSYANTTLAARIEALEVENARLRLLLRDAIQSAPRLSIRPPR